MGIKWAVPGLAICQLSAPMVAEALAEAPDPAPNATPAATPAAPPVVVPEAVARTLAWHYGEKRPAPPLPPGFTIGQGYAVQRLFVDAIAAAAERRREGSGQVAGYKAALTNPAVQERFGVTAPVMGVLLSGMLLPSGARVGVKFGAAPLYEGDLAVRVRSAALNTARTRDEVLMALDAVVPFIELPDLAYAKDVKVDGPALVAVNAAARLGVYGDPIPLAAGQDWVRRLADFKLDMLDARSNVEASGTGKNLLGHPLDVVIWLRDAVRDQGMAIETGDLLSLGTVTKLVPVTAPGTIRARYTGLDPTGPVEITAEFVEEPVGF